MRTVVGVSAIVLGAACGGGKPAGTSSPCIEAASCPAPPASSSQCIDNHGAACTLLVTGVYAQRLALDATNVYWTEVLQTTGGVGMVPKQGGASRALLADVNAPGAVAADSAGVYTGLAGGGAVVAINASTSVATTLASVGQAPDWLALDEAHTFVATQFNNVEDRGTVAIGLFQVARTGGATTVLQNGAVGGVVADATGVYWATDTSLVALRHGLTTPTALTTARGGNALALDEAYVYFVADAGVSAAGQIQTSVSRVPKIGGPVEVLLTGDYVRSIAIDVANVYALKMGDSSGAFGQVVRLPKAGGGTALVADRLSYPTDMVLDDAAVYVADFYAAAIVRIAKP